MSRNSMNCKEVLLGTVCRGVVPARLYALAVVVLAFAMLALFSIVSCSSEQPAQTSTPSAIATATPTAIATATSFAPRTSPTPGLPRISLRVWVPPEFGPAPNSRDLDEIVEKFEEAYPGILVQISAKQTAGKGGLLDLLQGASQVAPSYVPDLVLMDDAETARAAGQNLLEAVDSFLSIPAEDLIFTNLLAVGVSGDMRYGIPFAMDFLHLAYRVPVTPSVPMNWAHILESGGRYLFASGASENYTSDSILIQYLGLDGVLTDAGGKTTLDSRILTRVLDAYNQLAESGALAAESLTLNSPDGAWSLYKIGEATFAEVWASQFIAEASSASGTAFARIPTRNGHAGARLDMEHNSPHSRKATGSSGFPPMGAGGIAAENVESGGRFSTVLAPVMAAVFDAHGVQPVPSGPGSASLAVSRRAALDRSVVGFAGGPCSGYHRRHPPKTIRRAGDCQDETPVRPT